MVAVFFSALEKMDSTRSTKGPQVASDFLMRYIRKDHVPGALASACSDVVLSTGSRGDSSAPTNAKAQRFCSSGWFVTN